MTTTGRPPCSDSASRCQLVPKMEDNVFDHLPNAK